MKSSTADAYEYWWKNSNILKNPLFPDTISFIFQASIHIGVWKLTFCVSGKCVDVEDYRRDPTALVKYFEGSNLSLFYI